ncbi:MAG: SdpA family antimicrobial peptide system protein [Bacteroidetes bacterium]|nr:SdpA family antimicrobial peptide system protein [Bacteroidota bacterium]
MIRFIFFTTVLFISGLIGYVMVGSLPGATISISKKHKIQTVSIVPEGWAFFTKDPQDEDYILFSKTNDKPPTYKNEILPTSSPKNIFGFNRVSRLKSQELGSAVHLIRDSLWVEIKGSLQANDSLIQKLKPKLLPINSKHPYLNGIYIIQKISPIPWAWAKHFKEGFRKSKICKIVFQKPIAPVR